MLSGAACANSRASLQMTSTPLALTDRDFDAYLPEKAASNAFTRPRLEVKQRALSWARNVTTRLADQGLGVEVHATDEHPSHRNKRRVEAQWVFFWRDEVARNELDHLLERSRSMADAIDDPSPYTRHAFLGLRVDASAVEVCFAVHPEAKVDIDNLRARLAEGSEHLAEELAKALHALPDQFEVRAGGSGDVGEAMRLPASAASPEQLAAMLARCASETCRCGSDGGCRASSRFRTRRSSTSSSRTRSKSAARAAPSR